jgi:transposase
MKDAQQPILPFSDSLFACLPNPSFSCVCEGLEANCPHQPKLKVTLVEPKTNEGETTSIIQQRYLRKQGDVIGDKQTKRQYKQNWPIYNEAQTNEKAKFQVLLFELCRGISDPVQTMGRPRMKLSDVIFGTVLKVYSTLSTRRNITDLLEAHSKGYLSKPPHYNTLFKYAELEILTHYLKQLIEESGKPLRSVECDFAGDASGFSTSCYQSWAETKWGKAGTIYGDTRNINKHEWIKVHLMCGVKTNIVTSVVVTRSNVGDSPCFKPLIETTARNFVMKEVSADKAYSSANNLHLVMDNGAVPYIPFKSNAKGTIETDKTGLWKRMYHFYQYNQEWFKQHYHKRSNVETTFSMIKRKFGTHLRSKTLTAQINEALCKVLCHNLCVVIQSMYELGIEPVFWTED